MKDKIFIRQFVVLSKIGLTPLERRRKQKVIVDIEILRELRSAGIDDDIAKTVNYKEVLENVRKTALEREYNLLEHLAEEIASGLLGTFDMKRVDVVLKKAKYSKSPIIGIKISRSRSNG